MLKFYITQSEEQFRPRFPLNVEPCDKYGCQKYFKSIDKGEKWIQYHGDVLRKRQQNANKRPRSNEEYLKIENKYFWIDKLQEWPV